MVSTGIDGNLVSSINPLPVINEPKPITGFYSFNNFNINDGRGWTLNGTQSPMFAVRVKPPVVLVVAILPYVDPSLVICHVP